MRPTRLTRMAVALAAAAILSSCTSAGGGAAVSRSSSPVPSPRVPMLNDALLAEACALPQLPVVTEAQRAELKRRSLDVMSRHEGVRFPRSQSDVWFLVHQLLTLADLRPGESFFGSTPPRPADGRILANTLKEGLRMLTDECSAVQVPVED